MLTFRKVNTILLVCFLCLNLLNLLVDTGPWPYTALFASYFFVVGRGSSRICSGYHFPVKCSGSREHKVLSLTFDDGPDPVMTPEILDVLQKHEVSAGFFFTGWQAAQFPEIVDRTYKLGHLIGNHTYNHGFLFDLKPAPFMVREIRKTGDAIHKACGYRPVHFRPPYGVTNPAMKRALRKTALIPVGWSVKTSDTTRPAASKLLARLMKSEPGDVILLHDRVQILPEVLDEFISRKKADGWIFERPDKMPGFDLKPLP